MKIKYWISFLGIFLSLIGTLIIMDIQPFKRISNAFGGFGKEEKGWQQLTSFTEKDIDGKSISVLQKNEEGFEKILEIILNNRTEYSNKKVQAIVNSTMITYSLGNGKIDFNIISLLTTGQSIPDVVASEEITREWTTRARTKWILSCGLIFVIGGFLFSSVANFYQLKVKKQNKVQKKVMKKHKRITP